MTKQSRFGLIFIILFLLPFAGAGLFCLLQASKIISVQNFHSTRTAAWAIGFLFSFIGFGGLYLVIKGIPQVSKIDALQQQHPREPWLWKPEWVARRIPSSHKMQMGFFWVFAIIWNGISWPIAFVLPREWEKGNQGAWVVLVFPLIGLWLLWMAIRETLRWVKFGEAVFIPETLPGVIGLQLKGFIDVPRKFPEDARFRLKLVSIHKTQSGSGKNRSTWEKILWQEEQNNVLPQASYDPSRWSIPVLFPIPLDNRSTDTTNTRDETIWRLEAVCEVPGLDYQAQFDVPVFVTEASKNAPVVPASAVPLTPYEQGADAEVKVAPGAGGGKEFYFPPFRHQDAARWVWFFPIFFGACAVFWALIPKVLIAALMCGFVAVIMGFVMVAMTFGFTRVVIQEGKALISKGVGGRILSKQTVTSPEIHMLHIHVGTQIGEKPYYDIQFLLKNNFKVTAGGMIANKREAEWIAAEMSRLLNLPK